MTPTVVEAATVTFTTSSSGAGTFTAGEDFDHVLVSPVSPRTGFGSALVAVTAEQTAARTVTLQCNTMKSDHTVWPLVSAQCTVALVFIKYV